MCSSTYATSCDTLKVVDGIMSVKLDGQNRPKKYTKILKMDGKRAQTFNIRATASVGITAGTFRMISELNYVLLDIFHLFRCAECCGLHYVYKAGGSKSTQKVHENFKNG